MSVSFNTNIIGLKPSATLAINEKSNELIQTGKKVYKLGFGQSPFPVPQVVVDSLRENAHQKNYLPVKGLYQLRASVADYYHRNYQLECTAEDVLIGPGSKELLFLTQLICQGELLLPQPSWVSYAPQAELVNKTYTWLPTFPQNDWLLNADDLEEYCYKNPSKQKILLLNYPSNPTGSTLNKEDLQNIAKVARKYNVIILSDEIYADTHHEGQHVSIAKYYPEATIVSSGLSKWCGAGGWRLGTFVFPKELRHLLNQMAIVASETFTSTSAPIQYAAVTAYQNDKSITQYIQHSQFILKTIAKAISEILIKHNITHPKPIGGFYLMPDFSFYKEILNTNNIFTSTQLCDRLLEETGVALLPLADFGMPESFLGARLSYVDFDGQLALEKINENYNTKATELAPRVLEGILLLVNWLTLDNYTPNGINLAASG